VKRNTLMIGVATGFAVLLAACGGGSGSSASTTPKTATPKTAATSAPTSTTTALPASIKLGTTTFGSVLVDPNGMTLYQLDKDSPELATCTGACASIWPPVVVAAGATPVAGTGLDATKIGFVNNANGQQVVYGGHPLYRFSGDKAPGQTNGQGFAGGIWWVVGADGGKVTGTTPASPAPAPATMAPAAMPAPSMGMGRGY
jgi:predicted lipoprotein with Yx(FWY)xxD motif